MDEDCVSSVQGSDIISSNNLVDVEEDNLDEGHDQELYRAGHADHGSEGDKDGGHREVGIDQSLDVDVYPRPVRIAFSIIKCLQKEND